MLHVGFVGCFWVFALLTLLWVIFCAFDYLLQMDSWFCFAWCCLLVGCGVGVWCFAFLVVCYRFVFVNWLLLVSFSVLGW